MQVGGRQVDCGRRSGAAHRSMDRGCSRITEKIEEFLSIDHTGQPGPDGAVIEKETGIEIIGEVDEEGARPLLHFVHLADIAFFFVLAPLTGFVCTLGLMMRVLSARLGARPMFMLPSSIYWIKDLFRKNLRNCLPNPSY